MSGATDARAWPVMLVWVLLVAASVAGMLLAESYPVAKAAETATILLAAIKIHLVFRHYMEVSGSQRPRMLLLHAWLALVTILLLSACWLI